MRTSFLFSLSVLPFLGSVCFADKAAPDAEHVRALIEQLDDDLFDVRERAEKQLREQGRVVVPLLEEALKKAASLEVRWRLVRILDAVGGLERRVRVLMAQLGHDEFSKREEADRELRKLGKKALPLLKKEMAATKDLEISRRLKRIIQESSGEAP